MTNNKETINAKQTPPAMALPRIVQSKAGSVDEVRVTSVVSSVGTLGVSTLFSASLNAVDVLLKLSCNSVPNVVNVCDTTCAKFVSPGASPVTATNISTFLTRNGTTAASSCNCRRRRLRRKWRRNDALVVAV